MRIVIIGAMAEEINPIQALISPTQKEQFIDIPHWIGSVDRHEIILCQSGICKVNATITTATMLHHYNPDLVINIGSAGGIGESVDIADIVVATELNYHDVDATAFGYSNGQVPNMPTHYESDNKLIEEIKKAPSDLPIKFGLIVSGDCFVNSEKHIDTIKEKFPSALALDMESTAVAQTCYKFKTPFIIMRTVSDHANNHSDTDFQAQLHRVSAKLATQLVQIIKNLS